MKRICVLGMAAALGAISGPAAEPGFHAQFVGGTMAGTAVKSKARVDLSSSDALILRSKEGELRVDYLKIETIEYGQNVSRRYAEAILISPVLLLAKSRKHFVTLEYLDDSGHPQALVLRVEKGDIRSVLAGLEARTGRRVEYQDNEARKGSR